MRRAVLIGVLALLLVACHAVAFAVFAGIAGLIELARARSWRRFVAGVGPLVLPAAALAAWTLYMRAHEVRAQTPTVWASVAGRIRSLPATLLAAGHDSQAVVVAILLVIAAALVGVKPSRDWTRWIPAAAATAAYLLIPESLFGQILMAPRFAVVALVLVVFALEPRAPLIGRRFARSVVVAISIAWLLVLALRFHQFDGEARGFDGVVNAMGVNQSVLLLNLEPRSEVVTGLPFLHFACYCQERKGGVNGWSFANNFPSLVRYRPGAPVRRVPPVVTYDPRLFAPNRFPFDWYVVHAEDDMSRLLFGGSFAEFPLRARSGSWWLYAGSVAHPTTCLPLEDDRDDRRPVLSW